MKTDLCLLRTILLGINEDDPVVFDSEKLFEHVRLLLQDGWIKWANEFSVRLKITDKGRPIFNMIRDDFDWLNIRSLLLDKDLPITVDSIKVAHKVLSDRGVIQTKRFV